MRVQVIATRNSRSYGTRGSTAAGSRAGVTYVFYVGYKLQHANKGDDYFFMHMMHALVLLNLRHRSRDLMHQFHFKQHEHNFDRQSLLYRQVKLRRSTTEFIPFTHSVQVHASIKCGNLTDTDTYSSLAHRSPTMHTRVVVLQIILH